MKHYVLQKDETVLLRKSVQRLREGKKVGQYAATDAEVLLTNLHIVVSENRRAMLSATVETEVYDVHDVKVYDGTVQVIREKRRVSVYLNAAELFLEFEREQAAKEFCDRAHKLISGYSKLVRAVKKTQKTIPETTEALDIDIVGAVKTTVAVAGEITVAVASASGTSKARIIGGVVDKLIHRQPKQAIAAPASEDETAEEREKETV